MNFCSVLFRFIFLNFHNHAKCCNRGNRNNHNSLNHSRTSIFSSYYTTFASAQTYPGFDSKSEIKWFGV